mgnify:CR=1 FL=1
MEQLISAASHRSVPLLEPNRRIAPYPAGAESANMADVIFLVDRNRWMQRDVLGLARHIYVLNSVLVNAGVDLRFGAQPFEKESQPAGPLRTEVDDIAADLETIYFNGAVRNVLRAVNQSLRDQSFRTDSRKAIVVFSDSEAHDDYGSAREETAGALRAANAALFYVGSNDRYTGYPFGIYEELASATGGRCVNFENIPIDDALQQLAQGIFDFMISKGASLFDSQDRVVSVGPGSADRVTTRFPDFRPQSLGLKELPLETEQDYRQAIETIKNALNTVVSDRREKLILQDYLQRILRVFDELRKYRLDFKV